MISEVLGLIAILIFMAIPIGLMVDAIFLEHPYDDSELDPGGFW